MIEKEPIPEKGDEQHCSVCGSFKPLIRGRFPGDPQRRVCPTCTYEKLELITYITNDLYGKTNQEKLV